ncbi:MAG: hypothetical protein AAB403_15425 [Planctomycetota bacterium]
MTADLVTVGRKLPAISIPWPFPLEGTGLVTRDLVLEAKDYRTAEEAIAAFRMRHTPSQQPYFRRYYLKRQKRTQDGQSVYSLMYVWDTKHSRNDVMVGTVIGEDIQMAIVLIGNHAARCYMTPIRWVLCEDRLGADPIEMGRFDPWDLLTKVDSHDLERLARKSVVPRIKDWDFDHLWWERKCPRCSAQTTVLGIAFNIDSVVCAQCGARPWLSGALHRLLALAPVSATDEKSVMPAGEVFTKAVAWMGHVNASATELEPPVRDHMLALAARSDLLVLRDSSSPLLAPAVRHALSQIAGPASADLAEAAASELVATLIRGDRFNPVQSALANLLNEASRIGGGPRLLC